MRGLNILRATPDQIEKENQELNERFKPSPEFQKRMERNEEFYKLLDTGKLKKL